MASNNGWITHKICYYTEEEAHEAIARGELEQVADQSMLFVVRENPPAITTVNHKGAASPATFTAPTEGSREAEEEPDEGSDGEISSDHQVGGTQLGVGTTDANVHPRTPFYHPPTPFLNPVVAGRAVGFGTQQTTAPSVQAERRIFFNSGRVLGIDIVAPTQSCSCGVRVCVKNVDQVDIGRLHRLICEIPLLVW